MLSNKIRALSFTLFVPLAFVGCSSGGDGGNNDQVDNDGNTGVETGVFIDSPVVNIGYRTATQQGLTNTQGEFNYVPGETVTFFIGDLEFPSVTASSTVTPLDIANTNDPTNDTVVNMIRLLQTLDQDGDPDNGITITADAITNASQVDFALSAAEFSASTEVANLISNGGQTDPVTELVPVENAIAHFESQLTGVGVLTGTYYNVGQSTDILQSNTESFIWAYTVTFERSGDCSYIGILEQGAILQQQGDTTTPRIFDGTAEDGNCTYSLVDDGTLIVDYPDYQTSYVLSPDANTIVGVDTATEMSEFGAATFAGTYIDTMVKQSSGLNNASLNGTYHSIGKSVDLLTSNTESFIWTEALTFDGAGGCSYVGSAEGGAIVNNGDPQLYEGIAENGVCTYSLTSDGWLTIDGFGSLLVSPDTNTIVGIGAEASTTGDFAGTYFLSMVKQSTDLSNASLSGTYYAVAKTVDLYPNGTESYMWRYWFTFDGQGGCSFEGIVERGAVLNDSGNPAIVDRPVEADSGDCSYSVASDGALTLGEQDTYSVSPDGSTIIGVTAVGGGNHAGTYVELMVKTSE
jgi:hypothetical protein